MDSFSNNLHNLRESYYSLEIGCEQDSSKEPVWVKKLRNILERDIHQKSLGCHIQKTHIQIGTGLVHMNSFFEAQILFSHAKWVARFTRWLEEQLDYMRNEGCLVIGYDTYIEPLLSNLKSSNPNLQYCIYEDPQHMQNSLVAGARLRYFKEAFENWSAIKHIVYLCGISSTLSTFEKMRRAFYYELTNFLSAEPVLEGKKESYYSIVQVLAKPEASNINFFALGGKDCLEWDRCQKIIYRKHNQEELFHVRYLVDVETVWDLATKCRWCFPKNFLDELPLIITDFSSVIPMQQIGAPSGHRHSTVIPSSPCDHSAHIGSFDSEGTKLFFKQDKSGTGFLFKKYIYYSHIVRGNHHFRYYIRTNAFFGSIMNTQEFQTFCEQIQTSIQAREQQQNMEPVLRILLSPLHFSNNRFPHEINRRVFQNTAHEISFDPGREYRSNFETKYSNYAYILEQIHQYRRGNNTPHICFYYADDEIITGETFHRAKSFVSSLLYQYAGGDPGLLKQCEVFSSVFTLIDRTSASDKRSYVPSTEKFFSFVHFSVPVLGNYGDTCPICQEIEECRKIGRNCCLSSTELYWKEKEGHLRLHTLEQARKEFPFQAAALHQRYFTRFYCENRLCEATKNCWDEQEILQSYICTISSEIKELPIDQQFEFLISFLKALSRPALYCKENGKKAAMRILLTILSVYLETSSAASSLTDCSPSILMKNSAAALHINFPTGRLRRIKGADKQYNQLRYQLLCILLSCLSNIGSNYLIGRDHIVLLCDCVEKIDKNYCRFSTSANFRDDGLPGFYTLLVNYFKRLICGVSGREKSIYAKDMLSHLLRCNNPDSERRKLYQVLYLENIQFSSEDESVQKHILDASRKNNQNTIRKYLGIGDALKSVSPGLSCTFFAYFRGQLVELSESLMLDNDAHNFPLSAEVDLQQMGYCIPGGDNQCFWVMFQAKEVKESSQEQNQFSSQNAQDITKVYLRMQFETPCLENFDAVQKILIQRRSILEIIQADIETGALNAAIQAKAAEAILLTDKTQSHGTSKDINRLYLLVEEQFSNTQEDRKLNKESLYRAYNALNLFMNRCIAVGATKSVLKQIFSSPPRIQSFGRFVHLCERDGHSYDYLDTYLSILTDKDQTYLTQIKGDLQNKAGVPKISEEKECQIEISIDKDSREKFRMLKFFPSLINITTCPSQHQNNVIQLIGILDIFIRNAVEHTGANCKIEIACEIGEQVAPKIRQAYADYRNSYRITVRNKIPEGQGNTPDALGFTKLFFTKYLNQFSKNDPRYFEIKMEETPNHVFEAQFLCVAPDIDV